MIIDFLCWRPSCLLVESYSTSVASINPSFLASRAVTTLADQRFQTKSGHQQLKLRIRRNEKLA
jgi:hypothetical protein